MEERTSVLILALDSDDPEYSIHQEILKLALDILEPLFKVGLFKEGKASHVSKEWITFPLHASTAFLYFRLMEQLVYPVPIYGAIGYGECGKDPFQSQAYQNALSVLGESRKIGEDSIFYNAGFLEDDLLNSQLYSWWALKQEQSSIQRHLAFCYEMQTPIYLDYAMTPMDWPEETLNLLASKKEGLEEEEEVFTADYSKRKSPTWIEMHERVDLERYTIQGMFQRGYATTTAEMIGTTRQNVDYHLKNGKFEEERNLTASILLTLEREERAIE